MPIAKVNGIEIYYEIKGEGSPLALLCGFTLSSDTWEAELIKQLAGRHKLVLFDNRGTGRSTKPVEEYSIKTMADDLAGLLDEINIPGTHVYGHSMGGLIAQEFALNHSDKVMKLVLGCTYCGGKKNVTSREVFDLFQNLSRGKFPEMPQEELIDYFLRLAYSPNYLRDNRENIIKRLIKNKYPSPPDTWVKHAMAVTSFDASERIGEIKKPTLILHGEEDDFIAPYNSKILNRNIPDSKLVTLKDAGHTFIVEAREKAVKLILGFLSE
jgi:pimeloyl-ACP methyl ester carboxylesterase